MSRFKNLKKDFTKFVSQLSPDEVREQLVLAYLQMEKCQEVLKGTDVEPEKMMDNGESSDLELFYRCKKNAKELAYLNKMVHEGKKVGTLQLEMKIDTKKFEKEIDSLREYLKPRIFDFETFLRLKGGLPKISERFLKRDLPKTKKEIEEKIVSEWEQRLQKNMDSLISTIKMPNEITSPKWAYIEDILAEYEKQFAKLKSSTRFAKGQNVWYMFGDRVQHSTIEYPMRDSDGIIIYKTALGHDTAECETFVSLEELMEYLKNTINEQ